MTREEAIKWLKDYIQNTPFQMEQYERAFEMAIQALSQEPCTDAVSRDAVIYYIKGHIHEIITEGGTDKNAHTNSILRALINGVETMPSVTQKPKTGHWIEKHKIIDYVSESTVRECSECGAMTLYQDKYCHECGAKMVEPQESEE